MGLFRRFQPFRRVPFCCRRTVSYGLPLDSRLPLLCQVSPTCQIPQNRSKNVRRVSQKSSKKRVPPSAPATSMALFPIGGPFPACCCFTADCLYSARCPQSAKYLKIGRKSVRRVSQTSSKKHVPARVASQPGLSVSQLPASQPDELG